MSNSTCSVLPIRVDVSNADKSVRIVDTFLLDPFVWPKPSIPQAASSMAATATAASPSATGQSSPSSCSNNDRSNITTLIRRNANYLAEQMIEDSLVLGMGRTARHFTNRLPPDVFKPSIKERMQQQISDQIFQQLYDFLIAAPAAAAGPVSLPLEKGKGRIEKQDGERSKILSSGSNISLKRSTAEIENGSGDNSDNHTPTKKLRTESGSAIGFSTKAGESLSHDQQSSTTDFILAIENSSPTPPLIPIRIRLSAFGVRIHDDFDWDPTVPLSPLEIAKTMSDDLNLSPELELAVAIDIAEQIVSQTRRKEILDTDATTTLIGSSPAASAVADIDPSISKDSRNTTAAWLLDPKVQTATVALLVQMHQPVTTTSSSSSAPTAPVSSSGDAAAVTSSSTAAAASNASSKGKGAYGK